MQSGFILRQFYDGVFDAAGARTTDYNNLLANRPGAPLFPSGSTFSETLTASAVTVENAGDDYGSLMRGYIIAPMDGDYTLAINSDDSSALWVSADHTIPGDFPSTNPGGQRAPDAEETGCCASLFGGARVEARTTDPITLSRGEIRYVEMISQEGGGGAFMELGWTLPDGTQEPIPGGALIPYTAPGTSLELAFGQSILDGTDFGGFAPGTSGPDSATVDEARSVTFTVNVFGGQQPYTFQWMENGSPIDGAILGHYTIENAELSQDSNTFSVEITDANGASVTSPDAFLTVLPDTVNPAVLGAVGSGSPQGNHCQLF